MSSSSRFLVYGDQTTTFPWIRRHRLVAPVNYTPSQSPIPSNDLWRSFVWDRAAKASPRSWWSGTAVPCQPAGQTAPSQGSASSPLVTPPTARWSPTSAPIGMHRTGRTSTRWLKTANAAGLMIVVAGVIDPLDRGGSNTGLSERFPTTDAATRVRAQTSELASPGAT